MKRKLNCILLIDDDEPTNFLNKMIIDEASCAETVQVEQSATDALDYLTAEPVEKDGAASPDLIFLDINMPAMDGWEFLDEYKKLTPDQKARVVVVMLTTSYNPEDEVKAKNHNMIAAFRNKPLTTEMLMDVLQEYFPEKF
ncbi:response regulator [Pseudobacter ginsenosidimutans]|uniref:CheY-like chemotaxis protein n=1 Tax=Pseudobacter ginsenosidimutans TaxID=661488 RepID=A0A4Q7N2W1_9BACT|nr:response regulator [Pseudobacter ginsenosidimutans]QEC43905.1 response regulator [Pseudobacter ginsenosidimutans]RZS75334.1 CheY-like chemotaxis protein [Pseudobacter ginsenosidimutans]